jgi:hypothetical protein
MKKQTIKKVVRITYEYEDGEVREAVGDEANAIANWWRSCEVFCHMHNMLSDGPTLKLKVEGK